MMDTGKPYDSSVPQGGVYTSQVNYGFDPQRMEVQPQNVGMQSTVMTITQDVPPVRDHILWSIFSTIYMNFCCLGFAALIYSIKSRDRKLMGDRFGAITFGSTARKLNIATTTIAILWFIIMIILIATGFFAAFSFATSSATNQNYNPYDRSEN